MYASQVGYVCGVEVEKAKISSAEVRVNSEGIRISFFNAGELRIRNAFRAFHKNRQIPLRWKPTKRRYLNTSSEYERLTNTRHFLSIPLKPLNSITKT